MEASTEEERRFQISLDESLGSQPSYVLEESNEGTEIPWKSRKFDL
jgi:hypothetical protein